MSEMRQDIRNYIVENFLFGQDDLEDDTSFLDRGILDSTGVLYLVDHIELTYGIKVENDEMLPENLDTIEAISAYIERKQAGAAQSVKE